MSEYSINTAGTASVQAAWAPCSREILHVADDVRNICLSLSIQGDSRLILQAKLSRIAGDIEAEGDHTGGMAQALSDILRLYKEADSETKNSQAASEAEVRNGSGVSDRPTGEEGQSGNSSDNKAGAEDKKKNPFLAFLDFIKVPGEFIFTGWDDKTEGDSGGVANSFLKYLSKLVTFWDGDKRGLEGIADWCGLSSGSYSLWKAMYKQAYNAFNKIPDSARNWLFTDRANRNIAAGGIISSLVAMGGKAVKAWSDGQGKPLYERIALLLDQGDSVFNVWSSSYKLAHIKDTAGILKEGNGLLNPLRIYEALASGGFHFVSQHVRSINKYYEDGVYTFDEVASTGVDVSVAGLYGICHSLSFGGDVWLVNQLRRLRGQEEISGEEYLQQVQEGLKKMAADSGVAIGNKVVEIQRNLSNFREDFRHNLHNLFH